MRRYVIIFILVILSTLLIHVWLVNVGLFPAEASLQAGPIDQLFRVHLWLISFLFSLIMVTLIYNLIAFRRRKGESGDGIYLTGNSTLEIAWTAIPLFAVLVLAFFGARTLGEIRMVDPSFMQVNTAGQWFCSTPILNAKGAMNFSCETDGEFADDFHRCNSFILGT
jgi:cytochrome c oxidase subunit 2